MAETCATCRFWLVNHGVQPETGFCRRKPKRYIDSAFPDFRWPPHLPSDWCGEHQPVAPAQPEPDDYTRAAPLKAVLEQERDKAREQRDDYKRQLLELQRKCEAMAGASTYGNAAVMWGEAEVRVMRHLNEMPDEDDEFDEWQDERAELRAKADLARDAFLRLYREKHGG